MEEKENTTQMERAEEESNITMAETAGETNMGAAASNDESSAARLCKALHVDHGNTGDGSRTVFRCGIVAGAAGERGRGGIGQ